MLPETLCKQPEAKMQRPKGKGLLDDKLTDFILYDKLTSKLPKPNCLIG